MTHQKLLSYVRKAVDDYNMISENDHIAVGISGGKDSSVLLLALSSLRRFYPKKFELEAVAVSLGFPGTDYSKIEELCGKNNVRLTIVKTDIGQIIFDERKEENPCSLCSKMRKGALNDMADKLGCNKVALGHNKDDVIETFYMSLFFEGRINTFAPISYLDRKKLYSIRPLMYVPETEIKSYVLKNNIELLDNPCPANGFTKRQEIKELIKKLSKTYPNLSDKTFGAIKRSGIKGWESGEKL